MSKRKLPASAKPTKASGKPPAKPAKTARASNPAKPPATATASAAFNDTAGAYDARVAAAVCRRLAEGESFNRICADAAMPSRQTLRHWLDTVPEFAQLHERARRHQADALIDSAIETAHEALAHDNAASVRVKIDALLKLAAQLGARLRSDGADAQGGFDLAAAITAARARLARAAKEKPAAGS